MHALGFKVIGTDPYFKATPETDEYVTAVSVEDIYYKIRYYFLTLSGRWK